MDINDPGSQQISHGFYALDHGRYEFLPNTFTQHDTWTAQPMDLNPRPLNTNLILQPLNQSATHQYQQHVPPVYVDTGNYNWTNSMILNRHFYQVADPAESPLVIDSHPILLNNQTDYSNRNFLSYQDQHPNGFVVQNSLGRSSNNHTTLVRNFEQPPEVPFSKASLSDLPAANKLRPYRSLMSEDRRSVQDDGRFDTQASSKGFIRHEYVSSLESREGNITRDKKKPCKITPKKKPKNSTKIKTLINKAQLEPDKALQSNTTITGDLRELLTKTTKVMKNPIVRRQTVKEQNVSTNVPKTSIVSATPKKQRSSKLLQMLEPLLRMNYSIRLKSTGSLDGSSRYTISLTKMRKQIAPNRLSSLYDSWDSVLVNLASYRLTNRFASTGKSVTEHSFTHNICPHDYICLPDLIGTCPDKSCLYQHQSNYLMTDIEKLVDILSYKPSLTGFKADTSLSQEDNARNCRLKLKHYAAKLIAKNSDKTVETIAQNLLRYVRGDKSDHELLVLRRKLPKVSQLSSGTMENIDLQRRASIKSLANRLSALEKTQAKLQKTFK